MAEGEGPGSNKFYARWPLLLASVTCVTTAVALDLKDAGAYAVASSIGSLGAASFGAFLYAEGARHREWWHRHSPDHDKSEEDTT